MTRHLNFDSISANLRAYQSAQFVGLPVSSIIGAVENACHMVSTSHWNNIDRRLRSLGGDMVRAPAQWRIGGEVSCYVQFGHGNSFHLLADDPAKMRNLIEIKSMPGEAGTDCIPRVKL